MNKSFIDLFEEQVLKTPDNVAVVFEGEQMSYKELNEHSNILAHYIRSTGIKEETLIPLFIERSNFMITGILGIMKAGCAYVPIDIDFPAERMSFILKDTEAEIIVSSGKSKQKLPCTEGIEVIELDSLKNQRTDNLQTQVLAGHLAYVIYTSGSTGNPKGVMIEQGNLSDYVIGLANKICINECNSFALVSTIATDLGNTVIYGSMATGGTLHILSKELVSHIERLHQYFEEQNIDCLKIVPSHWRVLNLEGKLLLPKKLLVFGGEALQEKIVEDIRLSGSSCQIINHYGPTETTIGKLLHIVESGSKYEYTVPIGKPFSNTKVLVLDKNLKLCAIGVPGQLFITGDGVARGYLNNPELTKEKFIANPFSKQADSVMYSTGDTVKYLPDGNISFIGRVDNQVKIRGYRIELGEIENALQQCSFVSQAVVLALDDKQGNKRLVGYVITNELFDREAILAYLKDKLPDHMIPVVLIELDSFPLTANGKIDRKSLPDPDVSKSANKQYIAPRNDVESKLVEIWADVLEVDQVGINDDFFELGGHSLLAVRLVSAIRKKMDLELSLNDVFIHPTIMDFTENLLQKFKDPSLPNVNIKYLVPLKTAGNKIPLYIVAGGGGTALRFMGFAELM
nr:non-ribosomal peptide synthetase [Bacteroidota bacterium]